jgi:hypothetical protein
MILYTDIESVVYNFNGTIYGGYVRDKMIKDYYKELYYISGYLEKDINNPKIGKSTIKRLIEPNDMDIYFKNKKEAKKFIEELETYGNIIIIKNNDFTYTGIYSLIEHKEISLIIDDKNLIFDISYPLPNTENECNELEPPFNNLDMLCNGFLMDNKSIRYSKSTGTYIDDLDENERKKEIANIRFDIYEMKTYLIRGLKIEEPYIIRRIYKMINRKFGWIIINTPFIIIKNNNECICKKCNEYSQLYFKIGDETYDKNCFYEKLYLKEF